MHNTNDIQYCYIDISSRYCMCKALANGHPIAALLGNADARSGAAAITASGTCVTNSNCL